MEALKAINTRRSIRTYKDKKVPASIVKKLITAGMNAPSAFNDQPWVFITITKQETKDLIASQKSQKSKFMTQAPLLIACCYDDKKSQTTAHNLENIALAAGNIMIAANSLGLGTCYIGAFDPKFPEIEKIINKVLKLPRNVHIVCLLSVGYHDMKPGPKKMRLMSEVLRSEVY